MRHLGINFLLAMLTLVVSCQFGHIHAASLYSDGLTPQSNGEFLKQQKVITIGAVHIVDFPEKVREVILSQDRVISKIVRSPKQIVIIGKRVGVTDAFFFNDEGKEILSMKVRVEHDLEALKKAISRHFTEPLVKIESIMGKIVLSGNVSSTEAASGILNFAEKYAETSSEYFGAEGGQIPIINHMNLLEEDQVTIKVKIAEVSRSVTRNLGVEWGAGGTLASFSATSFLQDASNKISAIIGGSASQAKTTSNFLEFTLTALERNNLMYILSEPSLTAISGKSATFTAGGKYPITTGTIISASGNEQTSYTYENIGISLDFTPTVLSSGRINLKISTSVSEISNEYTASKDDATIKGISNRKADTTVELPSGGTIILAGLMNASSSHTRSGIPGLKDVPLVGALFSRNELSSKQTELLILATPYIVNSVNEKDLVLPTDRKTYINNQLSRLFMGKVSDEYGGETPEVNHEISQDEYSAPSGFMIN